MYTKRNNSSCNGRDKFTRFHGIIDSETAAEDETLTKKMLSINSL